MGRPKKPVTKLAALTEVVSVLEEMPALTPEMAEGIVYVKSMVTQEKRRVALILMTREIIHLDPKLSQGRAHYKAVEIAKENPATFKEYMDRVLP